MRACAVVPTGLTRTARIDLCCLITEKGATMPDPATLPVALGVPGVRIAPGDHLCAFYRGLAERDEILIPYLLEGLLSNDKCICVVDATDPEAVLAALAGDLDLTPFLNNR